MKIASGRVPVPRVGPNVPRRGNVISRLLSLLALRLSGWTVQGELPNLSKFVIIVAPHTSNWDFLVGMTVVFALGLRCTFLGKHTLFRGLVGVVMRWLGGLPVDRTCAHDLVAQTVTYFESHQQLVLGLSPEGTRKKLPAWHTGFYHVARGAKVPIVPVAFDYPRRCVHIFPLFNPTADAPADLELLRSHFHAGMAFYPDQY